MMKTVSVFLVLNFYFLTARSQTCNCKENFQFVVNKTKLNYPGFHDKVNASDSVAFNQFTDSLLQLALTKENQPFDSCMNVIKSWIKFFHDGHMYVYANLPQQNEDKDLIRNRYKNWPKVNYTGTSFRQYLKTQKNLKPLEGLWTINDRSYTIGIIFTKSSYKAFIINADSLFWMPGQVKFEVPLNTKNKAVYYKRNHDADSVSFNFKNDAHTIIALGDYGNWYKINPQTNETYSPFIAVSDGVVNFQQLSKKTNLLTIKSFEEDFFRAIDSVLKTNDSIIQNTDYLIIDVRNNGGGSDAAYSPLKKYFYTNPYNVIGTDFYCTDDNIRKFTDLLNDSNFSADDRKEYKRYTDSMQLHKGGYWSPFTASDEEKMDAVLPYPKKISVLINGYCASTTEQFLLDVVKNSKKAITMGTHSEGVLDYANMQFLNMPCVHYQLGYPTSRTKRIALGKVIDNTGIKPDIALDEKTDWVESAQQYLEK